MSVKISVFFIRVKAILCLLLYNFHDVINDVQLTVITNQTFCVKMVHISSCSNHEKSLLKNYPNFCHSVFFSVGSFMIQTNELSSWEVFTTSSSIFTSWWQIHNSINYYLEIILLSPEHSVVTNSMFDWINVLGSSYYP